MLFLKDVHIFVNQSLKERDIMLEVEDHGSLWKKGFSMFEECRDTTFLQYISGGLVRRLKPLAQLQGLNLRHKQLQSKGLFKTCRRKFSGSLQEGKLVSCDPCKKGSLIKCSYSTESDQGYAFEQESNSSIFSWTKIAKKLDAFYTFTRPYTIYATIVTIASISLLPLQTLSDLSPAFFLGVVKAIIPAVLVNIYMVGINQLIDVEVDKINKPFLPLASGEFSFAAAATITALSALSSFIMAVMSNSPPLLIAIISIFFIATAYSVDLPLLRWKENAFLTSLCALALRGLVIPLCFFAHAQKYILGKPLVYTKPVIFAVVFTAIIMNIIGVLKDLPDMEGDEAFGHLSPSVIHGRENVFWSCVYILLVTYGGTTILGATSAFIANKIITVLGHGILASILWRRAKSVNISDASATLSFYLFIWKLLYCEYLLIPFMR